MLKNYILADNQDITRVGLKALLQEMGAVTGIYEVTSYLQLLESLRAYPLSVVVVDYSLFDFLSMNHLLNMKSGAG